MTKADLRTGMIVTYRNGGKRTVFLNTDRGSDFIADGDNWNPLRYYNEDLTHVDQKNLDIVKVERCYDHANICRDPNTFTMLETIWERKEKKKYTYNQLKEILGEEFEIVKE